MLGILRFFLASCVIVFHLTAQVPNIGQLSVNFFYVISGYLITLILNETYHFKFKEFAINRFLRLYPTYYVFAIISIIIYSTPFSGVTSSSFHSSWLGGQQPFDVLGNLFIFPWAFLSDQSVLSIPGILYSEIPRFRLIPSTWSIGVEIVCYAILFVFSSRRFFFALLSFLVATIYHLTIHKYGLNSGYSYYPFMAAMLPFSIGIIGYYISKKIEQRKRLTLSIWHQLITLLTVIFLFTSNWIWSVGSDDFYNSTSYYANNLIGLFAIMALHGSSLTGKLKSISKFLGDLSYPMFLVQYVAGYIGWQLLGRPDGVRGWDVFISGYLVSLILSVSIILIIDKPIQKIRARIRPH